jgi:hypothetical protein
MPKVHALWSIVANVLFVVVGIIFIAWESNILVGIGGALVGAGIAGLTTTLKTLDAWALLYDELCISKEHGFMSAEKDIVGLRKLFHHYHVTRCDGQWVWRYERVDCGSVRAPGALVANIDYSGKAGELRKSVFRAGVVDNRLLASNKEMHVREDADVYMYPWMMEAGTINVGFEVRVTLDRSSALMPGILSEEPIASWTTVGTVTDAQVMRALNDSWISQMKGVPLVLPYEKSELLGAIRMIHLANTASNAGSAKVP